MKTYRQGDILLIKIHQMPAKAERQSIRDSIVLGEGEVAGHRHEIRAIDKVTAYRMAEGFYLEVAEETVLLHPEHEHIALLPGSYEVIRQVEFKRKEIVHVQD